MHTLKQLIIESVSRYCSLYMASNGKWYLNLAPQEYGEYEDAQTYGPFNSYNATVDYLDQFSNPGGWDEDDSGKRSPPTLSPNGSPVQGGNTGQRSMFSARPTRRYLSDSELKNRIVDIISDFGDEHGWDQKPNVQTVLDDLADETRKDGTAYHSDQARKFAERELGGAPPGILSKYTGVRSPPIQSPSAPPRGEARGVSGGQPVATPSKPVKGPAPGGKLKPTYKIYGAHHDAKLGSSPLHTRIKGKVYIPTQTSRFKKGDDAEVAVEPGGKKLSVKKPDSDHTQTWTAKESFELLIHDLVRLMHG